MEAVSTDRASAHQSDMEVLSQSGLALRGFWVWDPLLSRLRPKFFWMTRKILNHGPRSVLSPYRCIYQEIESGSQNVPRNVFLLPSPFSCLGEALFLPSRLGCLVTSSTKTVLISKTYQLAEWSGKEFYFSSYSTTRFSLLRPGVSGKKPPLAAASSFLLLPLFVWLSPLLSNSAEVYRRAVEGTGCSRGWVRVPANGRASIPGRRVNVSRWHHEQVL